MISVGSYEAKTHLPGLLDKVAHGEQITITRHGIPIAKIVPVSSSKRMDRKTAIERLQALSLEVSLDGLSIREMIEEGRKY